MNNDTKEILEDVKRKLQNGADYLDILKFLNEKEIDENSRKYIFDELDIVRTNISTNKLDVSIVKLIIGLPLSIFGTHLIFTGQFSWRSIIFPMILMIVGGIVSLVELAKIINNVLKK